MINLNQTQKKKLIWGAIVGAFLGVGAAWLLIQAPSGLEEDQDLEPITTSEVLTLTGAAATLLRRLDDFRRKM
jgi:NhaP-type Na+/H+ or K+/H+ antiporter